MLRILNRYKKSIDWELTECENPLSMLHHLHCCLAPVILKQAIQVHSFIVMHFY